MSNICVKALYFLGTNLKWVVVLLITLSIAFLMFNSSKWSQTYGENGTAKAAAAVVGNNQFGDDFNTIQYLDQGWNDSESLWFYNATQGSDLLPYDFFIALEQADNDELFRSNENINKYRYLVQNKSSNNPDGLPVGMVLDKYDGKRYMGFTCAACHTSQVNYKGVGIRIDGGQAMADMNTFMIDLYASLAATQTDSSKKERFTKAVIALGDYDNESQVEQDLKTFATSVNFYNFINRSKVDYGYARLDAFGRIYNRVLQHLITEKELRTLLQDTLTEAELKDVLPSFDNVLNKSNRQHIVEKLASKLSLKQQVKLRNAIFNSPDAPVSYPFLWDTPQHDYVQWNGIAANAGPGPIGRNTGEVMGVFGTLDWTQEPGWTLSSFIGGQGFGPTYISYKSSVDAHNLHMLESQLKDLQSPVWPENILPALDQERVKRGNEIFSQRCASCHEGINRSDPKRHVIAKFTKVATIGTDPTMANNSVGRVGYAGILENQYVSFTAGSVLVKGKSPVAALLTQADINVVATPDQDRWFFQRWTDWGYGLISGIVNNDIKTSMKVGDYTPDTTAAPFNSLVAYKARPLNGIWATAPYLHNGSVPTLYDLLLPASKEDGDVQGMKYRPPIFMVGSRELDTDHVGLKSEGYKGFKFLTKRTGNSNSGHEYGTRDKVADSGKLTPALIEQDRLDLVEYMKSL